MRTIAHRRWRNQPTPKVGVTALAANAVGLDTQPP
jgi:hypothetical protein